MARFDSSLGEDLEAFKKDFRFQRVVEERAKFPFPFKIDGYAVFKMLAAEFFDGKGFANLPSSTD